MERIVIRDNKGFTLVEVMVAFVIILIMMLGLISVTADVTKVGVRNTIRDEGVKVAEEVMAQVRALPYDKINTMTYEQLRKQIDSTSSETNIVRNFRNFTVTYNPDIRVTHYVDAKTIDVTVTWSFGGTNYTHTISSFVRKME